MAGVAFPEPDEPVDAIEPAALKAAIDAGDEVTILDTRAKTEYESWAIDGPSVADANVPYFDFLDGLTEDLLARVPDEQDLVVVCAKGDSSAYVASLLNQAGYEAKNLANGMRGWARLYQSADLKLDAGPTIRQYRRPSAGCLAYGIFDTDRGEGAIVDPLRTFIDRYVADARALDVEITTVLETHVHADHVSGARMLADETDADLIMPDQAVDRGIDYDADYGVVTDGDTIAVGDTPVTALHTPGHTSGMTSYSIDGELILTGDTLFVDNVARPDLEASADGAADAAEQLYETLQTDFLPLSEDTLLAAAHFGASAKPRNDGTYIADLGTVRGDVDELSLDQEGFVEAVLSDMPPRPANYEQIIATNMGQRTVSAEEAFELELGPNNCAAGE